MSAPEPRPARGPRRAGARLAGPRQAGPGLAGPGLASTVRAVTGAGPVATASFALLVVGCVFLAVAAPRASLAMRTTALHRQLAAVPAVQRSVELTALPGVFAGSLPHPESLDRLGPPSATAAQLAGVTGEAAAALAATPLPLGPRDADWASVETGRSPVTGAAARARLAGTLPEMEVLYQQPLARYARLAAGHWPRTAQVRFSSGSNSGGAGAAVARATFQVAVTQATAARFGLRPGSRLADAGGQITLDVTGVLRPVAASSAFWTANQAAAAPVRVPRTPASPAYWSGVAFAGPAELLAMQAALGGMDMQLNWDFPLNLSGLDADQVPGLVAALNRAAARTLPLTGQLSASATALNVSTDGPGPQLAAFRSAQGAVQTILALLFTGLTMIDVVAVLLAAQLMARRRAVDFALIRARGAALRQLAAMALRDGAAVAVPAAVAGAAAAIMLTPGGSPALAWWLGGLTLLAGLACLPLAVVGQHRRAGPSAAADRDLSREPGPRAAARRWVTEVALTAAAVGGLVLLRNQGLPSGPGVDAYPAAAPVLVAIPAALLVMRLYPALLRGLLRLFARRAPITWFIALSRAAWSGPVPVLPVFALVLALVLTSFAGMVRAAVTRGETAASWQAVGADAVLAGGADSAGFTARDERAVAAVPGVTRTTALRVMTWAPGYGSPVQVVAVNPASYAAFAAATPARRFPAGLLTGSGPGRSALAGSGPAAGGAGQPVPALATPGVRGALGPGPVTIAADSGPLTIRIAGTIGSTPALPGGRSFLVLPLTAVRTRAGPLLPDEMLLAGPHLDTARLTAVVHRLLPGASVTLRSAVLRSLASAPLQHGTYALFAAGIGAAAGLSVLVLLLALSLTARGRELTLTRLATMGLNGRQARLVAVGEALPAVLAAAVAGAACAVALAVLIGPVLDLAVFTGSAARVPVRADLAAVALPAAGLAVLGLLTLSAEVAAARRRGLARALRIGG
jgi:putative ABC transport system permease protein